MKGVRELNDETAKACINQIVFGLCGGWVHGVETLHDMIFQHTEVRVNEKRLPRLLDEMGLKVSKRWYSPYLGHDTHDHPCASFTNLVNREFYREPRVVILTDITYLYYDVRGVQFYKCAFIDAFTGEELGYAVSRGMGKGLVISAYRDMMANHRGEFKKGTIIHSDQGSQFRSALFRKMVKKDGFVQSMSNRGNSLDNAPMESFFRTFKDENSLRLLYCKSFSEAKAVCAWFQDYYNNVRTHTGIGGWIPAAFYERCVAYENGADIVNARFHVPESKAKAIGKVIEARRSQNRGYGDIDEEKIKEILDGKYQLAGGAEGQMDRDKKKLSSMIKRRSRKITEHQDVLDKAWAKQYEKHPAIAERMRLKIKNLEKEIENLEGIQGLIEKAMEFYHNASESIRLELNDRRMWGNYPEMGYYVMMKGMY